jgi:hypothetical protein
MAILHLRQVMPKMHLRRQHQRLLQLRLARVRILSSKCWRRELQRIQI